MQPPARWGDTKYIVQWCGECVFSYQHITTLHYPLYVIQYFIYLVAKQQIIRLPTRQYVVNVISDTTQHEVHKMRAVILDFHPISWQPFQGKR